MDQNQDKPVFDESRMTIITGAAGGVGGYREWHYAATGANETVENLLEDGYFSRMQQIASQDRAYIAGVGYSAELVFFREKDSEVIKAVEAWTVELPEEAKDPAVQTLPVGGSTKLSDDSKASSKPSSAT